MNDSSPLLSRREALAVGAAGLGALALATATATAAETQYGRHVVRPEAPGRDLRTALADLQQCLHDLTGLSFTAGTEVGEAGIIVARAGDKSVPTVVRRALADRGRE